MKATGKIGMLAGVVLMGSLAMPVLAQTDPNAGGQPPAGGADGNNGGNRQNRGGGRGNFDSAQFRQRMIERLKEQLGASDEEFKAIQPALEKVVDLNRDANSRGRGRGPGGPGGPGGGQNPDTSATASKPSAVQQASKDLNTTLENKDAKPDEIKAKLDAFRAAKAKAREDLAAAQKELQSLLTQRQEAVLVEDGLLN